MPGEKILVSEKMPKASMKVFAMRLGLTVIALFVALFAFYAGSTYRDTRPDSVGNVETAPVRISPGGMVTQTSGETIDIPF
jgi:hypothetical protein